MSLSISRLCFKDGCDEISQGVCQDKAVVYYHQQDLNTKSNGILVQDASLFISESNFLALHLTTCTRRLTPLRTQMFGIYSHARFAGNISNIPIH